MALPASTIWYSTSKFQIKLCKHLPSQLQRCSLWRVRHEMYPKCPSKVMMAQMGEPNKGNVQFGIFREKLWEVVPDTVKDFPWKKAKVIMFERLVFLGRKALKFSLIAFFIFSFLPDAVLSMSRNQDLMIPLGLLVGCLMTDFLRDILHEMFSRSEGKDSQRQILSIGFFFVLVKFMSACLTLQARVFLLHVANGGLIQVLWIWRSLVEENDKGNGVDSIANQDA